MKPLKTEFPQDGLPKAAESIDHAVGLLQANGFHDITRSLIRRLKKLPAFARCFVNGRVLLDQFVPALHAHMENAAAQPITEKPTKDDLECRRLLGQAETIEFHLGKLRDQFYPASEVDEFVTTTRFEVEKILRKRLKNELPPKVEGLRAPEIAAKMDAIIAELMHAIRFVHKSAAKVETA